MSKLAATLQDALRACGLRDGMTVSFHHHLRNGDHVLNMVLAEAARMGIRGLTVQASAIFDVHAPLIDHIRAGVVTGIETNYMGSRVGRAVSEGILDKPVVFRSHGGRPAAIESGRVSIDIAFIAAPAADRMGNANGLEGPAACGSLGYAMPDARHAGHTVVITDHVVPYPLAPASIEETDVDQVVPVDSIGDPKGIVSGTTQITRDPVGLAIARYAAAVIEHSGLMAEGFSFQTGAGGASLAVTEFLKPAMKRAGVTGSFGLGGITGYLVDMLEEGYFSALMDVQCFDLRAVRSIAQNPRHQEISASRYASPLAKSAAINSLDVVVLGATQIDTAFNVNVHTDSNGYIMGGSGGHSDTAAGARLAMIVAPLFRARLPIVVDKVLCVSTPGSTVDVLVTQRGIAVNPARPDLRDRLRAAGLPVYAIEDLKRMAEKVTGVPRDIPPLGRAVADVEYRDGAIIDRIGCVAGAG
ncbi:MAG: citrate lyase subunit alpha [Clostridiales bacterium]|jgi:citrate lyase subunit alpha/citrate CoA-transferase|nr:citrate lyase subunit alpha [Clostridiales bacterium]